MKKWNFVLIAALLVLSQVLAACAPAATPTAASGDRTTCS